MRLWFRSYTAQLTSAFVSLCRIRTSKRLHLSPSWSSRLVISVTCSWLPHTFLFSCLCNSDFVSYSGSVSDYSYGYSVVVVAFALRVNAKIRAIPLQTALQV